MKKSVRCFVLASVTVFALSARAAPPQADAESPPAGPALKWQPGPAKIPLGHALTLDLPADHVYLNAKEAKALLAKGGNFMGDDFLGMVIPRSDTEGDDGWWVAIEYQDEGYIKDDEKIDAPKILEAITEGNDEGNKVREEKGFPPLHIDGWSEPPRYDKALHHLVWAIEAHSDRGKSVNFNTRILGRKGYVSLNLITGPESLAKNKPEVEKLLANTAFDNGARYTDFNGKTDKVATYGLAALIAGGVGVGALKLAKVGLFAKYIVPLLLALKKGVILIVIALGGFLKKVFGGRDKVAVTPRAMVDQGGSAPPPASETPPKTNGDG